MENIFNPDIQCTDPGQLQFCLKISDNEFWYCEPNWYNDKLMPDADTPEREFIMKYMGQANLIIEEAKDNGELRAFLFNNQYWLNGTIETNDFSHEEKLELLDDYGYDWDDFKSDSDRNQIICENYFEQNPLDFRNDI